MVYLIYGSPCSGKTTYAKEHKKDGDIVCDIDRLYSAISFNKEHDTELYAQEAARFLFDEMLNIIRDRKGHWKNAYVITISRTDEEVQKMKDRINADEAIFIDTPYDVCLDRAKERPPYFVWLIQEWFEMRNFK